MLSDIESKNKYLMRKSPLVIFEAKTKSRKTTNIIYMKSIILENVTLFSSRISHFFRLFYIPKTPRTFCRTDDERGATEEEKQIFSHMTYISLI